MPDAPDANPHRLPRTVVPSHYDLALHPDLAAATFSGTVAIDVVVVEATSTISCNALDLEIDEAWHVDADGARSDLTASLDVDAERLHLQAPAALAPGAGTVHVAFRGVLNDLLRGFYRSTYEAADGTTRILATTQFEATDARRAFPCWDEPDRKATFAVSLTIADDLHAVANAAEIDRASNGDGTTTLRFAPTMVMSTYLVAFVVGDLEATAPVDVAGTPVRIVHVPGQGDLTAFALEVATFALDFFEDWYGIAYPGDKLDLVAVPDFAFGAMENLGCVTFREVLLLVDPARATQAELQRIVDVICHELAHMWFGDLVTMRWWEGIWLNEAFATFMEVLATDAFRPAWDRWVAFGLSRAAAFDVDALAATRPIEFAVESPAEAEGMFDLLTYEKGCSVVRMLEQYLGADAFRAGIAHYLAEHSYASTETADLWRALEAVTGEPVQRVADSWIYQGGHPVLDVVRDGDGLVVRQQRATADGTDDGTRWDVPILWRAAVDGDVRTGRLLLGADAGSAGASIDLGGRARWAVLNAGGHGFYRVGYDDGLRADLVTAAADGDLAPIERFGLLDDAWAAVAAGTLDVVAHLELVEALARTETDLAVWQRAIATLGAIDHALDADGDRALFAGRVRALLAPIDERLGAEPASDDDDRTRQLRGAVLAARALLGADPSAVERATQLHDTAMAVDAAGEVDPALGAAALQVVATVGDATTHAALATAMRSATNPQEELRLLGALVLAADPTLVADFLPQTLTDDVRTQNAPYVLRQAMHNRTAGAATWTFIAASWEAIGERFPSNSIARMLEGIRSLDEPTLAAEVSTFLDAHPVPQGAQVLAQHRERQRANVALRQRIADALVRLRA